MKRPRGRGDDTATADKRGGGGGGFGLDAALASMVESVVSHASDDASSEARLSSSAVAPSPGAAGTVSGAAVLCPVCRRHSLKESADIIFCACGLRLDTSTEGGVSCAALQRRVDAHVRSHSESGCEYPPTVLLQTRFGLPMLQMTCLKCSVLQVVI